MWNSQQPPSSSRDEGKNHQQEKHHLLPHAPTTGGHPDPHLASLAAAYQPSYLSAYTGAATPHAAYAVGSSSSTAHPLATAGTTSSNNTTGGQDDSARFAAAAGYPYGWEQQQGHASSYHNNSNSSNSNGHHASRDRKPSPTTTTKEASPPAGGPKQPPPPSSHADPSEDNKPSASQPPLVPRGKPEAMAQKLAAARMQASLEELEAQRREEQVMVDDDNNDNNHDVGDDDDDDDDDDEVVAAEPVTEEGGVLVSATVPAKSSSSRGGKTPRKPTASSRSKNKASSPSSSARSRRDTMLLSESTRPMTEIEYENLETLMVQFCRVPLLAEFSRPVTLLHPELVSAYNKIVKHPVDLGHVCRGIRRRQYKNTRDVRLDMWRVFANCVKFHSHPNNKEAVPSFVSIALHLREFFNNLWQEFMLPSDLPDGASKTLQDAFAKRQQDRKKNLENSGVLVLGNGRVLSLTKKLIDEFLDKGGCTDKLDKEPLFGNSNLQHPDLNVIVSNLKQLQQKLLQLTNSPPADYTVDNLHTDFLNCYSKDVLEDNPSLRNKIGNRLSRLFWKLFVPLHEANSRGVTQSSIWGNLAATIWARESSKKPFWPALCLGMLAPEEQREGWHDAVTERNEARLPEKLRSQLETAKRKCIQAQKRQPLSYFMVEFLGTHEFIWVRETDIVENFDPKNDPNKNPSASGKKKRSSRGGVASVVGSKVYATALEECVWASEEYESVLQDAYEFASDGEEDQEDGEEMNYSYHLLSQSDDEADDENSHGFLYDEANMTMSDIDEANWLLEHEGKLDTSAAGRKNAKKRTQALKKKVADKEKKAHADAGKSKSDSARKKKDTSKTKEKESKKEQRELDKRRKKRMRERDKALRSETKKNKRKRSSSADSDDDERGLAHDKRARATAIVRAYLTRMAKNDDFKNLGLGGVMAMPAAMVDSTGILGMALAFRSAAGEIPMPGDAKEELAKIKPWTAIDTTNAKTSAERTLALEKKATILKEQIEKVKLNTQRRKDLAREAIAYRLRLENDIEMDEEAARRNHFKKKKKYTPKAAPHASESKARNTTETDDGDKHEEAGAPHAKASSPGEAKVESQAVPVRNDTVDHTGDDGDAMDIEDDNGAKKAAETKDD